MKKQRLELTWIGKDERPRLEPRILLEDVEKSYHAAIRHEGDIFYNRLIFGDNLLALKALEQEFAGKVKCILIDPPYNTGSAFEHYDDGIEHSLWLSLMRDRLELLHCLLADNGSIWITIDDNEAHYLKVMCDEILGRGNFISNVVSFLYIQRIKRFFALIDCLKQKNKYQGILIETMIRAVLGKQVTYFEMNQEIMQFFL